jgi:membrane protein required for beta-lactamase induction
MKRLALTLSLVLILTIGVSCAGETTIIDEPVVLEDIDAEIPYEPTLIEHIDDEDVQLVGAFGEERDLNEEDLEVFEQALYGYVGMTFEPISVSSQVVAGMNYRFTVLATETYADAYEHKEVEPKLMYLFAFMSLDGEVELIDIIDAE